MKARRHRRIQDPRRPARLGVLLGLVLLACGAASAGEAPVKVEVLRAEAAGEGLDVLLRVELPGDEEGRLGPDDFAAYVAPANLALAKTAAPRFRVARIFLKRLHGAYYLDLRRLPPGAGKGACQLVLRVSRGGRPLAVGHVPLLLGARAEELDVVLLIDESLSMRRTDRQKLRIAAAKTFVDLAYRSARISRIAIVAFNHRARTLAPLTSLDHPEALHKAIERVRAYGQTDMDRALGRARSLFEDSPAGSAKAVVLLTDGKDEPGRYEDAHRVFAERRWRVFTVGLSERADHEVLRRIARDTGGEYHKAPTNAELQDIFSRIALTLQKQVAIRSRTLDLRAGKPTLDPFDVDDTIAAMTVRLQAPWPDVAFALRDPAARLITPELPKEQRGIAYGRKAAHQHFNVWTPWPGRWHARMTSPEPARVSVATTATTPLQVRAFPLKPRYTRGEPIEIAVSLANLDAILADAQVQAHLTDAQGSTVAVPLHDDGRHQDTGARDGVFAGVFGGSERPGPLRIRLVATGTTPGGHRFERELSLTATIAEEGRSKLWAAARGFDFGILYSGETARRSVGIKLTSAIAADAAETITTALDLPVADSAGGPKLLPRKLSLTPSPLRLEPGRLASLTLALTIPTTQPAGRYRGRLRLVSRYDRLTLPITLEVRHPKLVFGTERLDLGAVESGDKTGADLTLRLEPRGSLPVRLSTTSRHLSVAGGPINVGPKPVAARVTLAPPADHPTEKVEGKLIVQTPLGRSEVPVVARVVRPALALSPEALDFGEVAPERDATRTLALELEGLKPRDATVSASPLASEAKAPPLVLTTPAGNIPLTPGKKSAVAVALRVPPAQPPGIYRGHVTIHTPLGKRRVPCTVRVPAVATFRVASPLDFGRVAVGSTKEAAVEISSLADARQTVRVALPPTAPGWRLEATPAKLVLEPRGKARVTLRLIASAAAKPGARRASVRLTGPSRGAQLDVRAALFRPPHQSLAFDAPEADIGYFLSGHPVDVTIPVRSIVDEAQPFVVERIAAPADVVRLEAQPAKSTLEARGTLRLTLMVHPSERVEQPTPFVARLTVRGRSEPTTLLLRGRILPPPGVTFSIAPPVLDFGTMEPDEIRAMSLTIRSLHPHEQDLALVAPPAHEGITVTAEHPEVVLPPGAVQPLDIQLTVAADAEPGPRSFVCELAGPGESTTFEVRVEVRPSLLPPPVTVTTDEGIGWREALVALLLLLLLLAALLLLYLILRWFIRSSTPRPVKVFTACLALSALLHAIVLSSQVDLFGIRRLRAEKPGLGIKVALKAIAGAVFSSQEPSVADALTARRERASKVQARRRQGKGAQLSRQQLEARRRQLAAAKARLDRPSAEHEARLSERKPTAAKLTVEDLTQILEEVRETEKAREQAARRRVEPAATSAARTVPELRAMTREQLEAAIQRAIQPKAAEPTRPKKPAPRAPELARPRLTDKAAPPALDELLPAIEGLRQELTKAAARAAPTLAAKALGSERAARGPAIERDATAGSPPAAAARSVPSPIGGPAASRPAKGRGEPGLPLSGRREAAARAKRQPFAFRLETPEEAAPTIAQEAPPGRASAQRDGAAAAGAVTAARASPGAAAAHDRRTAAAAQPSAVPHLAGGPPGEPAPRPAARTAAGPIGSPGGPSARPRTAPPSFGMPTEAPSASDARVELPSGAPAGSVEAEAIAVRRAAAAWPGAPTRRTRSAALPPAAARGDPGAQAASAARPSGARGGRGLQLSDAPSSERRITAPSFDVPTETPPVGLPIAAAPAAGARPTSVKARALGVRRRGAEREAKAGRTLASAARRGAASPGAAPAVPSSRRATVLDTAPPAALASRQPTASAKAVPAFDEGGVELVEGRLVEPRRPSEEETGKGAGEPLGPRTLVARWYGRRRTPGAGQRASLAAAAPATGQLGPRAAGVGRGAAIGAPLARLATPGVAARREAGDWGASPDEPVQALPGAAQERETGIGEAAARAVGSLRIASVAAPERRQPAAAAPDAGSGALGPRRMSAGPRRRAAPALLGIADVDTGTGIQSSVGPDIEEQTPGESVEEAPRVALRDEGRGITERILEPTAPDGAGAPPGALPGPVPRRRARRQVAPRATPLRRSGTTDMARLLLPGVGRGRRGASALLGSRRGRATSFILATARYGAGKVDWDTHKTAMHFLAWQLRERIGFNVDTRIKVVPLESDEIFRAPWIYMSGHKNFRLPDAQVANLRRYLLAGGTLWADDSTHEGDHTWDRALRRELARVLPPEQGYRLRKITKADDHPLFRACFDLREGYAGYFPPPGDKYRQNFIEGIEIDGRLAVIYTRNDYGDGLEIRPDTFPLKASLSGLSPAEMQEASFMMACNIILYILTGGRDAGDRFVHSAADSLRRHHAARRAQPDPYADAPALVFENFAKDRWSTAEDWDGAGPALLGRERRAGADAAGRRLNVRFRLRRGQSKVVLVRDIPEEADLSGQDRIYVDLESRLSAGARLSIALVTLPGWKYFESVPAFIKPGRNRVHFDLKAAAWKTGEPVPEGQSEFRRRPLDLDAVRRVVLLLYPIERTGTVVIDQIELRAKP